MPLGSGCRGWAAAQSLQMQGEKPLGLVQPVLALWLGGGGRQGTVKGHITGVFLPGMLSDVFQYWAFCLTVYIVYIMDT